MTKNAATAMNGMKLAIVDSVLIRKIEAQIAPNMAPRLCPTTILPW